MTENRRSLKVNEKKILKLLMDNKDYTFREIAKQVNLNEVSVRRLHNRLKQDDIFHSLNVPNFAALGYNILMLQKIHVTSPYLIETKKIISDLMAEWNNCIDCHETYDGKIFVRSVWRNAEAFKKAHADFYRKFGTKWLQQEHIDMVPLDHSAKMIRINGVDFD